MNAVVEYIDQMTTYLAALGHLITDPGTGHRRRLPYGYHCFVFDSLNSCADKKYKHYAVLTKSVNSTCKCLS